MGGDQREGHGGRIWPKKPKMALISEYLAADLSADALCIINIGKCCNNDSDILCIWRLRPIETSKNI